MKIIQLSDRVLGLNLFGDVSREASDKADFTAGIADREFIDQRVMKDTIRMPERLCRLQRRPG